GSLGYRRWPFDFYGIGNETSGGPADRAAQEFAYAALSAGRSRGGSLTLSLNYRFASDGIDFPEDGPAGGASIPGAEGGVISGIGLSLFWDRRDAVLSPRAGHALQAAAFAYGGFLGSEHGFTSLTLDLRK